MYTFVSHPTQDNEKKEHEDKENNSGVCVNRKDEKHTHIHMSSDE